MDVIFTVITFTVTVKFMVVYWQQFASRQP